MVFFQNAHIYNNNRPVPG